MSPAAADKYRLPTSVRPTHYALTVRTDLDALAFDGVVAIDFDVVADTPALVLNAADLDLGPAVLLDSAGAGATPVPHTLDAAAERATFALPAPLAAGAAATLRVPFRGALTGSMMGYYRSAYEHAGAQRHYALTQFEPTAARRAFPCWDEPLLKATFAVTLVARAGTVSLSNMPAAAEAPFAPAGAHAHLAKDLTSAAIRADGAWTVTTFATTPPMSSYIVAYANGHFEHLESAYTSPLSGKTRPLRIYATADVIHQAAFALDVKRRVLPLYETVFDVEFPLPKLDTLVAHDFDAGAMENWGLITGRTSALLLDPARADLAARKDVAVTQSHEVAHMWFGNITTMAWWDYLYLNEGFATLMGEVIIADKVFPEWKVNSEFITGHLGRALKLDAKRSSHAIEVECPDANHINQIFDALSYSKAASVLRMLAAHVGEARFLRGVSLYLKKHLYANSVTTDLWAGIGEATGVDVVKIMDNWITKIGFPVLTVTETPRGIRVRQDRFLETGPAPPEENETLWTIPLGLLTTDADGRAVVDKTHVLDAREVEIELDTSKPFKLNAGTVAVCRVLYTPDRLVKIAAEAARAGSVFGLDDRIGLVGDALATARAGFAEISSALALVDGLRGETECLVWDSIAENVAELVGVWWEHPRVVALLNAFRRRLFVPIVDRLGYEYPAGEAEDTAQLRTTAISQAAAARDPGVTAELKRRFDHFVATGDDALIPADLQRVVFTTGVRNGGRAAYDAARRVHDKPSTPTARTAAIYGLGAAEDPALIEETLAAINSAARDQDVIYWFAGLGANYKARRRVAGFFRENYDSIYKRFEGNFTLGSLVKSAFGALSTAEDLADIEAFFEGKDTGKYYLALSQALDGVRAKIALLERSTADVEGWLERWEQGAKL